MQSASTKVIFKKPHPKLAFYVDKAIKEYNAENNTNIKQEVTR